MTTADGILLLNKARGITSAQALATAAKKLLQIKKAGHGGTLDPMACGLLIILLGEATRYAGYLLAGGKQYTADITFGYCSDTDDGDGVLTAGAPPPEDLDAQVTALLPQFTNDITQTVPAYSAVKHQGKPLYAYARRGQPVPVKTRRVHINSISLLAAAGSTVTLSITCGGGVYIRALARDIGAAIGCGAYLSALQRTACGGFHLNDAVTLEQFAQLTAEQRRGCLLPLETVVADFPAMTMPLEQVYQLGGGIAQKQPAAAATMRVLSPQGKFAGLVQYKDGCYRPLHFLRWTRQECSQ